MKIRAGLLLFRLVLAAVFLYAAATKLPDLGQFAEEVANYRLVPPPLVPAFSAGLVGVELLIGVLLLVGRGVRAAALASCGLLVVFIVALSQALLRDINLSCGCFGGSELATWGTVARDGVLLGLGAVVAWRSERRQIALTPPDRGA